jgi:hypothetical protein
MLAAIDDQPPPVVAGWHHPAEKAVGLAAGQQILGIAGLGSVLFLAADDILQTPGSPELFV